VNGAMGTWTQALLKNALDATAPILFAAMGGIFAHQAGLLNIGIEGMMLGGAFAGVIAAYYTGDIVLAVLAAGAAGAAMAAIFCLFVLGLRANVVVVGLAINTLAVGLTGYLLPTVFGVHGAFAPPGLRGLAPVRLWGIEAIPWLGPILSGHTILVYLAWVVVAATAFLLYRTVWGLRLRAVGQDLEAALAAGVHPVRLQVAALLISGFLGGLAGAQLSLGELTLFNKAMTGGRGFIALAAFYFGASRPWPTAGASLLFGLFQSLQFRLQPLGWPPQLLEMLPYVTVVATLVLVRVAEARRRARLARLVTVQGQRGPELGVGGAG